MDHIGIDVHKKDIQINIQICILTEAGELVERRVRMEASRFAEVLGARPRALGAYPDERIEAVPRTDSRVRLLRSMPSVGPVTAAAFVSAFDDPAPAHPRHRGPHRRGPGRVPDHDP
jgi:transposase